MLRVYKGVRVSRLMLVFFFTFATLASSAAVLVKEAKAASFKMQTGYYVGTNATMNIKGLGFEPQLLLLRTSNTAATVFKTSSMPANTIGYLGATAQNTSSLITFTNDGFDVLGGSAAVNGAGVIFHWTAFAGSDCTSSGTFCVGSYTGNALASRLVDTGFDPSLALVKRSGTFETSFRTSSMPAGQSEYFSLTANNTTGNLIASFASNGFNVGAGNNGSGILYYFVAFKKTAGVMNEGVYTGNGTDNRDVTGVGFKPDLLIIKNSTSATAGSRLAVMANSQTPYGITSYVTTTTANMTSDVIQKIEPDGFQLGTSVFVNENSMTHYWFSMGGVVQPQGTGTFTMATGTYTGNGVDTRPISGVGFKPDLIIIKDSSSNGSMVYRSSVMTGAGYIGTATGDLAGIYSLDADGFTISTSTLVNASGRLYHWQAFGNAYKPDTKSGAADFAVGAYQPTGQDDTFVPGAPQSMDFIHVKQNSSQTGVFRTSEQPGDLTGQLTAAPEIANAVQSIQSGGFEVGNNSAVNVIGANYRWFGFKAGSNFTVGSYVGDAVDNRDVTVGSGLQADLIWVKQSAGAQAIARPSTIITDQSLYIAGVGATSPTGRIKSITPTGMVIGNNTEINQVSVTYRYAAWRIPVSTGTLSGDIVNSTGVYVTNPSITMSALNYPFECSQSTGVLGTTNERVRINNTTTTASWTTSIAATDGSTALWKNGGNTQQYDYNESSGSPVGCGEGSDADTKSGVLRIEPSGATITPQVGCSTTNITLGSNNNFNETSVNAITLANASSGAGVGCYWDITGIQLKQYVPQGQASDTYNLNLTITTTAS